MAETRPKKGGRASRQKGNRAERLVVNLAQAAGLSSERIPLSGAAGGKFAGDMTVALLNADRRVECKARAEGFATLYRWITDNFALVVKADRKEPLVILRLKDALDIAVIAERAKGGAQ